MDTFRQLLLEYGGLVGLIGSFLVAAGACTAAVISARNSRDLQRRLHGFAMLSSLTQSKDVLDASFSVVQFLRTGGDWSTAEFRDSAQLQRHLYTMLHVYQFLALSTERGFLDKALVLQFRYGSMRLLWKTFEPYIRELRMELERPHLFVELEAFVRKYEREYEAMIPRMKKDLAWK